jgi:hypothetical protein
VDDDGVLVPVLDFFNHDHFSCHVDLVRKGGDGDAPPGISAVVRPGSSVEQGEEVLFSYGAKPNSCLLLSYGFVQFDNVHDVCYLHLPVFLGLSHVSEGGSPRTIEGAALMSARFTLAQELVEDGRHTSEEESARPSHHLARMMEPHGQYQTPTIRFTLQHGHPNPLLMRVARMMSMGADDLLSLISSSHELTSSSHEPPQGSRGSKSGKRIAPAAASLDFNVIFNSVVSEANEERARQLVVDQILSLGDELLQSDSADQLTEMDEAARVRAGLEVGSSLYTSDPHSVAIACRSSCLLILMNALDAFGAAGGDDDDDEEEEEEEEEEEAGKEEDK